MLKQKLNLSLVKFTNSSKHLEDFGFQNQTKNRLLFLNVKEIPQSKKTDKTFSRWYDFLEVMTSIFSLQLKPC